MSTVAQILAGKPGRETYTISPDASVLDAIKLMAEKNIGALVVVEGQSIAGVITERDYARKVVLLARSSRETTVHEVMSAPVVSVRPGQTTEECMALMTERRMRHLPVMDKGRLIGIISIGDLVKDIIAEQRFTIEQLEHYIAS
jgi:IMP dehydrogenase